MAKPMKNTSIFQGVVEFETESGAKFRFVREGGGIWARYCKRDSSYVFDGKVEIAGRATPRKLWDASDVG